MRLYAHKNGAVQDFTSTCRINPDYTSNFRNDLEFYIPQICTFLLKGDMEDPNELFDFLIMASASEFFFAHRLWFFFYSGLKKNLPTNFILMT